MKKILKTTVVMIFILSLCVNVCAENSLASYMELSTTGEWSIFSKNMEDDALLDAVGKTRDEVNKILEETGSESLIINQKTGAHIHVNIKKNDLSYELWNISDKDDDFLKENLRNIVYDGFSMGSFNYNDENITIDEYPFMKFITVPGNAYYDEGVYGVICGGTFVNGNAIVFMMITETTEPTEEEIKDIKEIAKGVSFTVIKDKTDKITDNNVGEEKDVFNYILGGFGALVLIIFCAYMIIRMKNTTDETEEETETAEGTEE